MPDTNQLSHWLSQLWEEFREDQRNFHDFRIELGEVLKELRKRIEALEEKKE